MERVSTETGKINVIIVAPHGADDTRTDMLAETCATYLESYAVINRGFERADSVDVVNDQADCNRIDHVKEPVVYEEYLKPIKKFKDKIRNKMAYGNPLLSGYGYIPEDSRILICHVHGCGNDVHKAAGEDLFAILGYGKGKSKHSYTMQPKRVKVFTEALRHYSDGLGIYEDVGGGKFAGRSSNNMNQFFKTTEPDTIVESVQIEFPYSTRCDDNTARASGITLGRAVQDYLLLLSDKSIVIDDIETYTI